MCNYTYGETEAQKIINTAAKITFNSKLIDSRSYVA